jgi:hypothetical protein
MRASIVTVVGLLMVTFAFWLGQAEAQHGKGRGAPTPPPKAASRPNVVKPHAPQPKVKAQQKAKAAAPKSAQKKQKPQDSAKAKEAEKKKHTAKTKTPEHAKKAQKKSTAGDGPDHEAVSILHAAHQKLHDADHDYDGHRWRASEHVGAALRHLGSFAESQFRPGSGRSKVPQSVSDEHLRQARASLETIRNRLASHKGATAAHREAHRAVDEAIREIDSALKVR